MKFLPENNHPLAYTGVDISGEEQMKPEYIKFIYEQEGMDKKYPQFYAMICWMNEASKEGGIKAFTFEEFL